MKIIIHTDGGARGNPGNAAIGVVIEIYQSDPLRRSASEASQFTNPTNKKKQIIEISKPIGETTNNVAEYTAVVEALKEAKNLKSKSENQKIETIEFYLDSTLVVNQLNGKFKVKDASLRALLMKIRMLESEMGERIEYISIPRERNTRADFLVNRALDAAM